MFKVRFHNKITLYITILLLSSCNPSTPGLDEVVIDNNLGNRRYIDGFFQWFTNAYELGAQNKDTTYYGQIVADTFVFTYFRMIKMFS